MSEVVAKRAGSTTAEDTLKQKRRDAGVVSGGHLVARAPIIPKNQTLYK